MIGGQDRLLNGGDCDRVRNSLDDKLIYDMVSFEITARYHRHIIKFFINIEEKGYSAVGREHGINTQGETIDELFRNMNEAIRLYFEEV